MTEMIPVAGSVWRNSGTGINATVIQGIGNFPKPSDSILVRYDREDYFCDCFATEFVRDHSYVIMPILSLK